MFLVVVFVRREMHASPRNHGLGVGKEHFLLALASPSRHQPRVALCRGVKLPPCSLPRATYERCRVSSVLRMTAFFLIPLLLFTAALIYPWPQTQVFAFFFLIDVHIVTFY